MCNVLWCVILINMAVVETLHLHTLNLIVVLLNTNNWDKIICLLCTHKYMCVYAHKFIIYFFNSVKTLTYFFCYYLFIYLCAFYEKLHLTNKILSYKFCITTDVKDIKATCFLICLSSYIFLYSLPDTLQKCAFF